MNNHSDQVLSDASGYCLGSFMLNNKLLDITILEAKHFLEPAASIFATMQSIYRKHGAVINEDLFKTSKDVQDYIIACCGLGSEKYELFEHYQNYVIEKWTEREIIKLSDMYKSGKIDLEEFETKMNETKQSTSLSLQSLTGQEIANSCWSGKANIKVSKFYKLQGLMRMKEHDFVILAGSTGVGKSGFAMNLLHDLSTNYPCYFFNFEMGEDEFNQRLVSIDSGLSFNEMEKKDANAAKGIKEAARRLQTRKITSINNSMNLAQIKSYIAKASSQQHIIVFIDHIGLIGVKGFSAYDRMTEVAKELRKISLDYNCTIIGLSQLNRESTRDTGKSPSLSMLRDSGEVEQSANKVLFIWKNDKDEYSLRLLKNRSGNTGVINIDYKKTTQQITELSQYVK
ncbi:MULTISPECIES: DnaB-like helicase C-terminal domain-containing protein [unclassified Breznakia]|uniref:DnaB-like helicase C-terminal domain-containing protein n=1 Tax=unclassified Breznakia TaxID=2623764 RepID=UPI0024771CAB|nr:MULTISPECIES: DnaB-like helicase C-terminal domain-containing protein [unclassified Breznakia]MDH6367154.1 replicative DNA helicase [Breznakia sp. PH1-1]MDH6404259.1 replicative DNA helicase [Breznakia sp. PF1-11]MDH6412042.1 replicative DNA helicase [Breznakia sp. PFB1-11]MDH6414247.1 replicative DNA helicase [Breznakia sp. PFB1-14]MDH6416656.1 replicative DNA helicase [Breznakia sp. PFB1-4]